MKKLVAIVVILSLCFTLCSCSSKKEEAAMEENYLAAIEAAEGQKNFEIAIAKLEKYPEYKDSLQKHMDYTYALCLGKCGFIDQYSNPDILNDNSDDFVALLTQLGDDFIKSHLQDYEDALFQLQELIDSGYGYNISELQKAISEIIAMYQ